MKRLHEPGDASTVALDARATREEIVRRLSEDLLGPQADAELLIKDKPSDRYLTGILYPQRVEIGPEDDEKLEAQGDDEDESQGSERESVALANTRRPASAGLSFAVRPTAEGIPSIVIRVRCGTYGIVQPEVHEPKTEPGSPPPFDGTPETSVQKKPKPNWQRVSHDVTLGPMGVNAAIPPISLADRGLPGLSLFFQSTRWGEKGRLVTVALVNGNELEKGEGREVMEEKSFFQTELIVTPGAGTIFPARPSRRPIVDADSRASALLYREALEFAVGHTCSASWTAESGRASELRTTWVPVATVHPTSADGSAEFAILRSTPSVDPLSATWLSESDTADLHTGLSLLPQAYSAWIDKQTKLVNELPEDFRPQALLHVDECRKVCSRMAGGIATLATREDVATAFRLANKAMVIQRRWAKPGETDLRWRPFQLGFLLLTLTSLTEPENADREVMDLLWFPTGGGKTEAYLGLIALCAFHRRIRHGDTPDNGRGVAAIMRYTLRLLTTQQFQRAAALVLACEYLRRGNEVPQGADARLGDESFSIGLWVGDDAVANHFADAAAALTGGGQFKSPAQIERCPACDTRLRWFPKQDLKQIWVECQNAECAFARSGARLPIWTVDDDVYREAPTVLIGTVDKFAQLVRNRETGALFGTSNGNEPPDLIIQDELHLISGPLGTMTALYEVAIDELCKRGRRRPKIIGSTATIRRAEDQVRDLFNRSTCQFPPPGIAAGDSGFAVADRNKAGRVFAGVTTAGRSAKFTLQAICASLLQSATSPLFDDDSRDPYWTLITYFNSLRELGGAVVLMRDDVDGSIRDYASRREEKSRDARSVEELTSRVSQLEVRDKLSELARSFSDGDAVDVLLASNMISVGVDIQRLGLMVVNGQPKGIAEYIQATSRVGRGDLAGLVVTAYNNGKARDRSHYESFATWHSMLYREVEATSVTPFASRSRDRALHAVLVGMVRHGIGSMLARPTLNPEAVRRAKEMIEEILTRVQNIDSAEARGTKRQLESILNDWENRAGVSTYWNDKQRNSSLLMSAEKAAALRAAGRPRGQAWPTPNSMRNVEPGTMFGMVERLKVAEEEGQVDAE
jgi:hypothetical protein